jgi:excisionase family DNA binding protein
MLNIKEVAKKMKVNVSYVRRLCAAGKIESHKVGRDWVITDKRYAKS